MINNQYSKPPAWFPVESPEEEFVQAEITPGQAVENELNAVPVYALRLPATNIQIHQIAPEAERFLNETCPWNRQRRIGEFLSIFLPDQFGDRFKSVSELLETLGTENKYQFEGELRAILNRSEKLLLLVSGERAVRSTSSRDPFDDSVVLGDSIQNAFRQRNGTPSFTGEQKASFAEDWTLARKNKISMNELVEKYGADLEPLLTAISHRSTRPQPKVSQLMERVYRMSDTRYAREIVGRFAWNHRSLSSSQNEKE